MRKIIASNLVSLDGYAIGPGHDLLALPFDDSFNDYNLQLIRRCGGLLAGRTTFTELTGYWLPRAEDPEASPLEREVGQFQRDAPKLVVSDSLTPDDVPAHTTIVPRNAAAATLREVKASGDGDLVMFGSLTLLHALLPEGVIDELHVIVGNAATGGGTPLLPAATGRLRLLGTWRGEGSDNVVLQYATA